MSADPSAENGQTCGSEDGATVTSHRRDGEERFLSGYTGRALLSTASGNSLVLVAMIVLSPMLPRIMATLEVAPFEAGFALSVMWGAAGLFQYPGGRAADELSRKTVLVGALVLLVAASFVLFGTRGYAMFLLGVAAIGISAGLYWPTMFALGADLFTRRRGGAFGIIAGSGDLGGLVATGLAGLAIATVTWQTVFLPVAVVGSTIAYSIHRWHAEPYLVGGPDLRVRETLGNLTATRRLRRSLVAFGLFMFVYQGTTSFLPTLLRVEMAFDEALASSAFAVLFLAGIVVKPAAGRLGDRVGYATAFGWSLLAAAVGLTLLLIGPSRPSALLGLVVFAAGLAAAWPTIISYVAARFPDGSLGGDLGGFRTLGYLFGSLGSTFVGFVAGQASFRLAFVGFVVCLLAAAGIVGLLAYRQ